MIADQDQIQSARAGAKDHPQIQPGPTLEIGCLQAADGQSAMKVRGTPLLLQLHEGLFDPEAAIRVQIT